MLEYCIVILHLVKCCEKMRGCLDQQTNQVEEQVSDPVLIVFDLERFGHSVNFIIHMKCVECVVGGNMGGCILVKTPGLRVAVSIIPEVTSLLRVCWYRAVALSPPKKCA